MKEEIVFHGKCQWFISVSVLFSGFTAGGGGFIPSFSAQQSLEGPTVVKKTKQVTKQKTVKVRKEFPETWLWTEEMVN